MSSQRVVKYSDRFTSESLHEVFEESDLHATVASRLENGYELNIDHNTTLDYHPVWKTLSR
jgi:hypothetical protein